MRKRWNKGLSRLLTVMLTWLGIGSASMLFVACYGTAPDDYQVIDGKDSVVVKMGSTVVTAASRTEAPADSFAAEE